MTIPNFAADATNTANQTPRPAPEIDPRLVRALLAQVRADRAAHPKEPLSTYDDHIRDVTGNPSMSFAMLQRHEVRDNRVPTQTIPGFQAEATYTPLATALPTDATPQTQMQAINRQNTADRQSRTRAVMRGATANLDRPLANLLGLTGGAYSPEGLSNYEAYAQEHSGENAALNLAGGLLTAHPLSAAAGGLVAAKVAGQAALPVGKVTLARILAEQGSVPNIIKGFGAGAGYGGVSSAADGNSAGRIALDTGLGAVGGALLPSLFGAGGAIARTSGEGQAAQRLADIAGQSGNMQHVGNVPVTAAPLTFADRVRDAMLPSQAMNRVMTGVNRNATVQADFARTGRGDVITPIDLDPSGRVRTEAVNANRGNPAMASSDATQALAARGAQTGPMLQTDMARITPVGVFQPGQSVPAYVSNLGAERPQELMRTATTALGHAPPVPSPTSLTKRVASTAGYNADARIAEIEQHLASVSASPTEGYNSLRSTFVPGQEFRVSPEVLDQARYELTANLSSVANSDARGVLTATNDQLRRLQGGVRESGPVSIKDVQGVLADINKAIASGRSDSMLPGHIPFPDEKLQALEQARDAVLHYANQGFASESGQRFSDIQRRYAQSSESVRRIQWGQNAQKTSGGGTSDAVVQELRAMAPEHRQEASVGIIGQWLSDLRAAHTENPGALVENLTQRAADGFKKNALLREAVDSPSRFQAIVGRQNAFDALDAGAAAFSQNSDVAIRDALNALGSAHERRMFRTALTAQMHDALQSPEQAQALLAKFVGEYGDVRRNAAGMQKLRTMFGDAGAEEMARSMNQQAVLNTNSRAIAAAAENPSAGQMTSVANDLKSGNPRGVVMSLIGAARKRAGIDLSDAAKNQLARVLQAQGPEGIAQFRQATLRGATPLTQRGLIPSSILLGNPASRNLLSSLLQSNQQQ